MTELERREARITNIRLKLFWKAPHKNAPDSKYPTDWDLVLKKAIENSPCAEEIFEVSSVLASLFGVWNRGRHS